MMRVVSSKRFNAMTIGDEAEVRRTSVGTKVLMMGCGVLAVLGSFWSIVWFIRSYVEAPRVTMAPMALAARESAPVTSPAPAIRTTPVAADPQPAAGPPPAVIMAGPAPAVSAQSAEPLTTSGIADRWMPAPAPETTSAAAPPATAPATLAATAPDSTALEEVAEGSVPAIAGPAPLPRRKPTQTAAVRTRASEPPLPRPRPDGPAPQSVWTAVPTTDDRFPQQ